MKIEAIVFDMDGLMVDTERVYWAAGREVARHFGREVQSQTLGRMMGRSPIDSLRVFATELGLSEDPAVLLKMRDSRVIETLKREVHPMPGLMDVLESARRRFKLAVATSATRPFVDVIFGKLGLERFFDVIQTSEGIVNGKPDPEIYLSAMSRIPVAPASAVVLEDSSNGARAGKRSGAFAIAIPSEHTRDQDFSFADAICPNLLEAWAKIESIAD